MRQPKLVDDPPPVELAAEHDEVGTALRDVAYRLTHDLSDTADDLRDAVAFAPLAAAKLAQRYASALTYRPTRTVLATATLAAIVLVGTVWTRRMRSKQRRPRQTA